jgi:hypothetical protein
VFSYAISDDLVFPKQYADSYAHSIAVSEPVSELVADPLAFVDRYFQCFVEPDSESIGNAVNIAELVTKPVSDPYWVANTNVVADADSKPDDLSFSDWYFIAGYDAELDENVEWNADPQPDEHSVRYYDRHAKR